MSGLGPVSGAMQRSVAITTSVCWALFGAALRGAVEAALAGVIRPTLVGPVDQLRALTEKIGVDISCYPIVDAATEEKAAQIKGLVSRVTGQADVLVEPDLESVNRRPKQLEYPAGRNWQKLPVNVRETETLKGS